MVFLNYSKRASDIIFAIDVSFKEWKNVFIKLIKEKKHLSRYKSKIWSSAEKKYNAIK